MSSNEDMQVPYNIEDAIASYGEDPEQLKDALRMALGTLKNKNAQTEDLNLNYGEEVLQNIQLDHKRRESQKMAEEWQQEAQKLRQQLETIQRADGDDDDIEEDPSQLKQKVEELNMDYGDEILQNARLQKEKRESLALAQKWQEEAEELRKLLDEEQNKSQGSDTMDEDERIRQMEEAMDEMESRLSAEQARAADLRAERRASIQAMHAYQQEATELRKLVTDETAAVQIPTTADNLDLSTLDPYRTPQGKPNEDDEDVWKKVEELGFELGDEILKNTKLSHEKRESVQLAEKWKAEAAKLKDLINMNDYEVDENDDPPPTNDSSELESLRAKVETLQRTNASLSQLVNDTQGELSEKQHSLEYFEKKNDDQNHEIADLKHTVQRLEKDNSQLLASKMLLIQQTSEALNQSRDYVRFLGALTKTKTTEIPVSE